MSRYWNNRIKNINSYIPGEQPKQGVYIKLNTNENPYPPSTEVIEVIRNNTGVDLRLYPDPDATSLRQAIAETEGVLFDNVFVGNGSDEILALCFLTFFSANSYIIFPDITYSFYKVYADLFNIPYDMIKLNNEFNIKSEDFSTNCYSISSGKGLYPCGIIIANPNTPTGLLLSLEAIEDIIQNNIQSVVVIDEAYIDFGGESAVKLTKKHKNLLIVKTFSKSYSLAGLRVGYAVGHRDLIVGLNKVKNCFNSYTLDRLALLGAETAIKERDYFLNNIEKIIRTRSNTINDLIERGFWVSDSKSNFLFVSHLKIEAKYLFEQLKDNGILVRYFETKRINKHIRITIGTDKEMKQLISVLDRLFPFLKG